MRRKILVAGAALVAVAAVGVAWFIRSNQTAGATAETAFAEGTVSRGDLSVRISGTAALQAGAVEQVAAEVEGLVEAILLPEGTAVEAGQVVLRLQNDSLPGALLKAEADLRNEAYNLEQILSPDAATLAAAELKVQQAEVNLANRQEAVAELTVTTDEAGVVSSLLVHPGDEVNAGDLLAVLVSQEEPEIELLVPESAAHAVREGQSVDLLLNGLGTARGQVTAVGSRSSTTAAGEPAVLVWVAVQDRSDLPPGTAVQAAIHTADPAYPAGVLATGTTPDSRLVEVRAGVEGRVVAAHARPGDQVTAGAPLMMLENQELVVAMHQAEAELETARQSLEQLRNPEADTARSIELATQRSRVEQARLSLETLQEQAANLTVKAPFQGIITRLAVETGADVKPGDPLFTVSDYSAFELVIAVDELDIAQVQVGQPAVVTVDALPGQSYQGRVIYISPEGTVQDGVSTFDVTIRIDRPEGLKAGMNATAEIIVAERTGVLWVPREAVVSRGRQPQVRRYAADGSVELVPVELGLETEDAVEILSGLSEGDRIITGVMTQTSGQTPTRAPMGGFPGGGIPGGGTFRVPGTGTRPTGGSGGNR